MSHCPMRSFEKQSVKSWHKQKDANNVTMHTFCQSPVTTNTQRNNANIPNERRITSDILVETLKRLMIHSTINDSGYYNSDEDDA